MTLYENWLRPLLFSIDPENAHEAATRLLERSGRVPGIARILERLFRYDHPALQTEVAGLKFPNPVGLAAGFDKDCRLAGVLPALGFGFLELGTVTPRPQPGNPKPRVFRVPEAGAILNRLGFNNEGAAEAARRLKDLGPRRIPIGINLGANASTAGEKAHLDYAEAFRLLAPYGDYFVVNVSSPNTPKLRELQETVHLERILEALKKLNRDRKPVFVKLSPDLPPERLKSLIPLMLESADGTIVSNTTVSRDGLADRWLDAPGGLSGLPLKDRATNLVAEVCRLSGGRLPVIGVGGIFTAEDAYQKIRAGASLVQVYTGLIYRGPGLTREICRGLARLLAGHGLKSIAQAVGASHKNIQTTTRPYNVI